MTKANKKCCKCGKCYNKPECLPQGGNDAFSTFGIGGGTKWCCNCMPKRACVKLYTENGCCNDSLIFGDYGIEDGLAAAERGAWCTPGGGANSYGVTFNCDGRDIDVSFGIVEEYDVCYITLSSPDLGYIDDDILKLPMGGDYNDPDIRATECKGLDFSFDISFENLTPAETVPPYCTSGTIQIIAEDNIPESGKPGLLAIPSESDCIYSRACLVYFDGYVERIGKACFDSYSRSYSFDLDDDHDVTVFLDYIGDAPYFTMTSSAFTNDDVVRVDCVTNVMYAKWDDPDDEDAYIQIRGDQGGYCVDCGCNCRCLCVTAFNSDREVARGIYCFDDTDPLTLLGIDLSFGTRCNCNETAGGDPFFDTTLCLTASSGTIVGEECQAIICPDQLDAEWSLSLDNDKTFNVIAECLPCTRSCDLEDFGITRCFDFVDRVTPIPIFLTATLEDLSGCSNLDGAVANLQLNDLNAVDDTGTTPCWEGYIEGTNEECAISMTCLGDGEFRIYTNLCSTQTGDGALANVTSSDPLILDVSVTGIISCCEPYPNLAEVKITVTE